MELITRTDLQKEMLPGRMIQKAVGKDAYSKSQKMTMGFGRYAAESGPMEPHHHAEEIIYVIGAKDTWVRHGDSPESLTKKEILDVGTILHFPPLEWHVFEYGPGGYLEIIFFYGQVDKIRPEEMN